MSVIVDCRAEKGSTWDWSPEKDLTDLIFETEYGWFTRNRNEIPKEVQAAMKTFGIVKAEVDPVPDADGCIRFIGFK